MLTIATLAAYAAKEQPGWDVSVNQLAAAGGGLITAGRIDFRTWSLADLGRMRVTENTLRELIRRDVDGATLWAYAKNRPEEAIRVLPEEMTAAQMAWFVHHPDSRMLAAIARCARVRPTERVEAAVTMSEAGCTFEEARDAINSLANKDLVRAAVAQVTRADVLLHFALRTGQHSWDEVTSTRMLTVAIQPRLDEADEISDKGMCKFIESASLTRAQLTWLRDHPKLAATQAAVKAAEVLGWYDTVETAPLDKVPDTLLTKPAVRAHVLRTLIAAAPNDALWADTAAALAGLGGSVSLREAIAGVRDALA